MPESPTVVDLFAGPGGWDCGLRYLGHTNVLGLEWDKAACETRAAAGHPTLRTDIAQYPTAPFRHLNVDGLIASPPCQAFSVAGNQSGAADIATLLIALAAVAEGDDTAIDGYAAGGSDPRAALVLEPIRWIRDLRPRWIALEQVILVLPLWEATCRVLRGWGYNVWTGIVNAADYGVPQTRRRAILLARNDGKQADPPAPSHAEHPQPTLFGPGEQPWVTLADALGLTTEVADVRAAEAAGVPAGATWVWDRPATTVACDPRLSPPCHHDNGIQGKNAISTDDIRRWVFDRPSTTIVSSFRPDIVSPPGFRSAGDGPRQKQPGAVKVSVDEAAQLQSFPAGYPWAGSKTKQREQIGNAVPPMLAAHMLAPLVGGTVPASPPAWIELAEQAPLVKAA